MTSSPSRVVVSCLEVPIEISGALADQCRHLARTTGPPVVSVAGEGAEGLAALTRAAVDRTGLLALHACVTTGRDGLLVIPGRSGLGKSTLSVALARAGFHHVSDEVLAVDRRTSAVTAFPRPITLDPRSWSTLGLPGAGPCEGAEALVDPADHGTVGRSGGRVRDVILLRRRPGAPDVGRATPSDVMVELIARCFNHHRDPAGSLQSLADVVRGARLWRLTYHDATNAATVLARLVGTPAVPSTERAPGTLTPMSHPDDRRFRGI